MSDLGSSAVPELIAELEARIRIYQNVIELLRVKKPEQPSVDGPAEPKQLVSVAKAKPIQVPKPAAKPPALESSDGNNVSVTPISEAGIRIGRTLQDPFSATDLQVRLDGDKTRAYYWVAQWKRKDWIDTVGFAQYRKTERFGL